MIKISHYCKCIYCGEKFDRDKLATAYIPPKNSNAAATATRYRYAHKDCYLKAKSNGLVDECEIVDPAAPEATVKSQCFICRKPFRRDEMVMLPSGQLACKDCAKKDAERPRDDKDIFNEYIMKIYDEEFVPPNILKQANHYIAEYGFTFKGMYRALKYFYEVKGNKVDKSRKTIGIIPYVYKQAEIFFLKIMMAREANKDKIKEDYVGEEKQIAIAPPQPKPLRQEQMKSEWWDDD